MIQSADRKFVVGQSIWIGSAIAIFLALSIVFPVYASLALTISILIAAGWLLVKSPLQLAIKGGRFPFVYRRESRNIMFCCVACGREHLCYSCPDCGSKLKKLAT
jgi:hypothetical protein